MAQEAKERGQEFEMNFRMTLYANDPERYFAVFSKEEEKKQIESEVEWIVPQNEEELQELMRQVEEFESGQR
jgi:hypothetical protein